MIATSDFAEERGLIVVLALLGCWGFVGAGLYAWARRPDNRIGGVMVLAGFIWMLDRRSLAPTCRSLFSIGGARWAASSRPA